MGAMARVLVVDDEPVITKSCERILRHQGMEVEVATSGYDGLELTEKNKFDAVLLDLKMPNIGGMEVLRRVKEVQPEAIVIIITGYPSLGTAVEAMKLGAFDYVVKPFRPTELTEAVKKALARPKPPRALPVQPPVTVKPRVKGLLGQGRSVATVTRGGKRVAILGLGGIFADSSAFFSDVVESLRAICAPINSEYGNHEVTGKEILDYLENYDKVIVVTPASLGESPGTVKKFGAETSPGHGSDSTLQVPQIGFPHLAHWAKAVGIDSDVVVIAAEQDKPANGDVVGKELCRELVAEILAELRPSDAGTYGGQTQ